MEKNDAKKKFLEFVYSMMNAAFMQMGKTVNPITGKTEKDLPGAKSTIDLLEMFEAKTKGNLDNDEEKFLRDTLTMLRLNYVEEVKTEESKPKEQEAKTNGK
ncbi:MAG: DUF1844 domain-containing protein [Candidatus Hydrogenedentota bacterium]